MSSTDLLVLDPGIRNWVLVPISAVMLLVGLFRHQVTRYLKENNAPSLRTVQDSQLILRATRLRMNAGYIPESSFLVHRAFFTNKEGGAFYNVAQSSNPMAAMQDPSNMMGMMKNNIATIVPQIALMSWVSYFFSGFVLLKLPFPLTPSFKPMLQRGVELDTLDVSYVSSLSWYFLLLFGLQGVFSILLGSNNASGDVKQMATMGMPMGGQPGQFDRNKAFVAERENLDLMKHEFALDGQIRKQRQRQADDDSLSTTAHDETTLQDVGASSSSTSTVAGDDESEIQKKIKALHGYGPRRRKGFRR